MITFHERHRVSLSTFVCSCGLAHLCVLLQPRTGVAWAPAVSPSTPSWATKVEAWACQSRSRCEHWHAPLSSTALEMLGPTLRCPRLWGRGLSRKSLERRFLICSSPPPSSPILPHPTSPALQQHQLCQRLSGCIGLERVSRSIPLTEGNEEEDQPANVQPWTVLYFCIPVHVPSGGASSGTIMAHVWCLAGTDVYC